METSALSVPFSPFSLLARWGIVVVLGMGSAIGNVCRPPPVAFSQWRLIAAGSGVSPISVGLAWGWSTVSWTVACYRARGVVIFTFDRSCQAINGGELYLARLISRGGGTVNRTVSERFIVRGLSFISPQYAVWALYRPGMSQLCWPCFHLLT